MSDDKPFSSPKNPADEALRKHPSAFPPPPLAQQEAYVERMIKRDREMDERGKDV
jgi:hypothetical protein